ncbi:rod shape-determining protein RodA [Alphaproteobacteria bacterium]|nr:rod shape-determining protein RodA [Alphaproteobacteria bacterium]
MEIDKIKKRFLFLNEFKLLFLLLSLIFIVSILGQFSAFNGVFSESVQKHIIRIVGGIVIMCFIYLCDFKIWNNFAYVFYALTFIALVVVELLGIIRLGAQRWIDLYFFIFQPSELMKLSLILALSRYYSILSPEDTQSLKSHVIPIALTLFPTILVLKQPDLGTAGVLFLVGCGTIFLSGFPMKTFLLSVVSGLLLCPFGWYFLHDYQKNRILTFMDPDRDPLGTGYHVLQSKIAIGSGYMYGKGFLQGTQSKLNFLPEKNTDFIFTTIAEELGFVGSTFIVLLFLGLILYFFWCGSETKTIFAKFLCYGLGLLLFSHVFINIAMVMGVVPVVGIPLPLLSYGGSSMITFMISCGLIMSSLANRKSFRS